MCECVCANVSVSECVKMDVNVCVRACVHVCVHVCEACLRRRGAEASNSAGIQKLQKGIKSSIGNVLHSEVDHILAAVM